MTDQAFIDGRLIMDSKQDLVDEIAKLRLALELLKQAVAYISVELGDGGHGSIVDRSRTLFAEIEGPASLTKGMG